MQAGLVDTSVSCVIGKETGGLSSQASSSTSPPCEKCNPNYFFQDTSNEENINQKYSLFGMNSIFLSLFILFYFIPSRDFMTAYKVYGDSANLANI